MQVAKDPVAGANDRRGLSIDEVTVRVTVAADDGIDDRAIGRLIARSTG